MLAEMFPSFPAGCPWLDSEAWEFFNQPFNSVKILGAHESPAAVLPGAALMRLRRLKNSSRKLTTIALQPCRHGVGRFLVSVPVIPSGTQADAEAVLR
jgi:hypothetical protein